jgi:hypothetical protein
MAIISAGRRKVIHERLRTRRLMVLLGVLLLAWPLAASAALIPSKEADAPVAHSRQADLEQVGALLARDEVARALSSRGLAPREVEHRLAQLSDEDLRSLAANVDQIQAAGDAPQYIWILLAVLIVVIILTKL